MKRYRSQEQVVRDYGRGWKTFLQDQQQASVWFNQNPQVTPIPTAGAWLYSGFSQAGNTNSNTTLNSLSVGTTMLAVGMTVTGTGIPAGTTISALGSATSGSLTLSQAATATATGVTVTFQGIPNFQSVAFGNYQFYGIPSPTLTDVPGCPWAIPESQTLLAGSTFIPAPGSGIIALTSGTTAMTLQYLTAATPTWTTFFTGTASTTTYIHFECDGGNTRVNCPTTNGSFIFYRFRGGFPIY